MSGEEFDARFGHTAIERARRGGIARNAAIVARNTGEGSEDALAVAATDPDPAVAGAARRALAARAGQGATVQGGTAVQGAGRTVSSRA